MCPAGPGQDFANLYLWRTPILIALKQGHQVFVTDFGCHAWFIDGPAPASAVPQIEGLSPNPAANALPSAPRNFVTPLTLLPLTLFDKTQTVDSNLDGNAEVPSVLAQRVITAHFMCFGPSHQYLLGDISVTRSEQSQSSQRFKACPADPDDTISGLHFPPPPTGSQVQADPSLKEKTWHLDWMPLGFLASFRPQRQPTRFIGEI